MSATPGPPAAASGLRHCTSCLAGCAVIFAATWLVYGRAAGFGYVGIDDVEYVVNTAPVREGLTREGISWAFTTFRFSNWHPLTWLSYMLDVSLFGDAPGPKHAVNIFLHACNSVLAAALVFRVVPARRHVVALLAGLSFAVHPLHVESVAWVAERKDVLCAFFYFVALHLHLGFVQRATVSRYLLLQAACALALMAKPMAVTLPVALLLLDYWPGGRLRAVAGGNVRVLPRRLFGLLLEKAPVILMAAAVCVLTIMAQQDAVASATSVPFAHRLQNAVMSYVTYLRQMILPTGLAPLYPLRPIDTFTQFLPALAVLSSLVAVVVYRWRVAPWWLAGMLFFLLTLLPVIGLMQVGVQAHADRYMYIPSLGLLLAGGCSLSRLSGAWAQRILPACWLVLAFHASLAWIQVGYWASDYMAYSRILDITPRSWEAHVGLSGVYLARGDTGSAESHAREALAIDSENGFVQAALGNLYLARRDNDGALAAFGRAHALRPAWQLPMVNIGVAMEREGHFSEALQWYCKALAVDGAMDGVSGRIARLRAKGAGGGGDACEHP